MVYVLFVHKKSFSKRIFCIIFIKIKKLRKNKKKNIFSGWFFWWVFYCQPWKVARLLLERGANPNLRIPAPDMETASQSPLVSAFASVCRSGSGWLLQSGFGSVYFLVLRLVPLGIWTYFPIRSLGSFWLSSRYLYLLFGIQIGSFCLDFTDSFVFFPEPNLQFSVKR